MKRLHLVLVLCAATAVLILGNAQQAATPAPAPTLLSLRIGQRFEDVVKASTFPVMQRSTVPNAETGMAGVTAVTEPSVILCFDDPQHGFVLPPTKFALVGYGHDVVETISTSPMLEKLRFEQAVVILENLQNQFKSGGWQPWAVDDSKWFDLSPAGRQRLYQRMFEPGHSQSAELRVPKKYGMVFRLKCTDGCWPGEKPPHLFLIDVGLSPDNVGHESGDPEVWEKSFPANVVSPGPARFSCPVMPSRSPP